MIVRIVKSILLIVAAVISSDNFANDTKFSGWVKSRGGVYSSPLTNREHVVSGEDLVNSGRLKIESKFSEKSAIECAYELFINYHNKREYFPTITAISRGKYRAFDLEEELFSDNLSSQSKLVGYQNLDRFFYAFSNDEVDIYIGRQAISFGSARFVNPTDVLVPYNAIAVDKEEREGVDAVRVKIPLGEMGELDTGFIVGDNGKSKNSAYYVDIKYPIASWDAEVILMSFRENYLLGLDLQGQVSQAGVWIESALVSPENEEKDYLRLNVGTSYNLNRDLLGFAEYHFNQAGSHDSSNYMMNSLKTAYQEGTVYLFARNYLIGGMTYQLTPLNVLTGQVVLNGDDSSTLLSATFVRSLSDNEFLDIGLFVGIGKKMDDTIHSEFGSYPNSVYIIYRLYL